MKNWLKIWKNRRAFDLEHALRAERPTPPAHLVKAISAHVRHRPVRIRLRLGRTVLVGAGVAVVLVGSSLAAGLGYTGGLHPSALLHPFSASSSPTPADLQYVGAPTITDFTPQSGAVGTSVTITGTNFGGSTVKFSPNVAAASTTFGSQNSVTVTVPSGAVTGPITISNTGGSAHTSDFTVYQTPTVSSFTPTSGVVGDGVTITGTNFQGATAVKFNNGSTTPASINPAGT